MFIEEIIYEPSDVWSEGSFFVQNVALIGKNVVLRSKPFVNYMDLLLYGPEYRPNMSSMIRSAEFFGFKRIYIYDQNELLKPPTNKKGRANMEHMARVWTAGAVEHIEIILLEDITAFLDQYPGRIIGTIVNEQAHHLNDFPFKPDDLILFGSEKAGLPPEVIEKLDSGVYIPALGKTDCLNVAVSFGIVVEKAVSFC